eukprot:m.681109 g.681109  ORF g.681109 m.681109 type:complete len:90 (-) comp22811_c2_seq5:994-1263(-)
MGWTLGDTVHDVAVEVIRSPEQMVVVVMNTDASGYSNLLCHIDVDRHWDFHSNTVDTLSLQLASAPDVSSVVRRACVCTCICVWMIHRV